MEFMRLFSDEFGNFLKETKVNDFRVSDAWTVKYSKGNENHCILLHNVCQCVPL